MKKFKVTVSLDCYYEEIEAKDERQAINIAWDWFNECEPEFIVEEVKEDDCY